MTVFVTGIAGFVGVNLTAALLARGERVAGFDNLCRGKAEYLARWHDHERFAFEQVDLADLAAYRDALNRVHTRSPITEVWHLAANSDIPAGIADPAVDHRDTFMTTFNTLVLMRELEIGSIAFASSSAVYGDLGVHRLTEDTGPLFPISNYGAMKLASEAMISAAVESYLERAWLFRFPNVIGVPATHGVIMDFVRKLKADPSVLDVLGDGTQQKGYLHVEELVDAMLHIRHHATDRLNCFNIGALDDGVTVRFIAETVRDRLSPGASIRYGTGNKGWVGDVPRFVYSVDRLLDSGWQPTLSSAEALRLAVNQVLEQESAG
ncbi:MAG: NAD-dependent epimerase/dehydratase family protein [Gammaproteobacteria bacterium]|nr:NAD-dependent epimerase/dehydratase family protein [Gammaproteobacteria bacterium]